MVHLVLEFKCTTPRCVESYATADELMEHMERHQRQSCPLCNKEVIDLSKHDCQGPKQFVCEMCGHASTTKNMLDAHYEAKHMKIPYECDICGKR